MKGTMTHTIVVIVSTSLVVLTFAACGTLEDGAAEPSEQQLAYIGARVYEIQEVQESEPGVALEELPSYTVRDVVSGEWEPAFVLEDEQEHEFELSASEFRRDYVKSGDIEIHDEEIEELWVGGRLQDATVAVRLEEIHLEPRREELTFRVRFETREDSEIEVSRDDEFIWRAEETEDLEGWELSGNLDLYEPVDTEDQEGPTEMELTESVIIPDGSTYYTDAIARYSGMDIPTEVLVTQIQTARIFLRRVAAREEAEADNGDIEEVFTFALISDVYGETISLKPELEANLVREVEFHN